ncbi:10502_t:CDS:2, partial [Scutellospora calospora]
GEHKLIQKLKDSPGQIISDNQKSRFWVTLATKSRPENCSQEALDTVIEAYGVTLSPPSPKTKSADLLKLDKTEIVEIPTCNISFPNLMIPTAIPPSPSMDISLWITAKGYNPKTFNCKPPH